MSIVGVGELAGGWVKVETWMALLGMGRLVWGASWVEVVAGE